ncbi:bifunctional Helicase [Babesia duncani]|uniref:RNA helicase n=1 Tax=Babesia duncani TaxID=323732 RepID=A0AAD9UMX2_9APIC|nr:bifunctional Helicase [Babesia duncani]
MSDIFRTLCRGTSIGRNRASLDIIPAAVAEFDATFSIKDENGTALDPVSVTNFKDFLNICPSNSSNLEWICDSLVQRFNIARPSPIQEHVIPLLLHNKNIIAVAPTGSGKTLAYLVPILAQIERKNDSIQALIVAPTVELVNQIKRECDVGIRVVTLVKGDVKGHVAVATPMACLQALENTDIIAQCSFLCFDEADVLFGDSCSQQLDKLLARISSRLGKMTRALFTSTIQERVLALTSNIMQGCICVTVGAGNVACNNVKQELIFVTNDDGKLPTLKQYITEGKLVPPILCFLQSVERVERLHSNLLNDGLHVQRITGTQTISQRAKIIENFRLAKTWLLLCTDLLSRGIDFRGISSVVNFDIPLTSQDYVNRIGRAGRGCKCGIALTFYTLEDLVIMKPIVSVLKASGQNVPDWIDKASLGEGSVKNAPVRGGLKGPKVRKVKRHRHKRGTLLKNTKGSTST